MIPKNAPRLAFQGTPSFPPYPVATVRRGVKWFHKLGEEWCGGGVVVLLGGDGGVIGTATVVKAVVKQFADLSLGELAAYHDPACHSLFGLYYRMAELYQGFSQAEYVTVITFEVKDERAEQEQVRHARTAA
jgi:hypothetical protein